jgi:hypothetical protein
MDKLVMELIALLQKLLLAHQQLIELAGQRQMAMKTFDIPKLEKLVLREDSLTESLVVLDAERRGLIARIKPLLGKFEPTITHIAARCPQPQKDQLLALAAALRGAIEQFSKTQKTNQRITQAVVANFAKVLRVVTGLAQQAGLYTRRGQKAALRGIHTLDLAG